MLNFRELMMEFLLRMTSLTALVLSLLTITPIKLSRIAWSDHSMKKIRFLSALRDRTDQEIFKTNLKSERSMSLSSLKLISGRIKIAVPLIYLTKKVFMISTKIFLKKKMKRDQFQGILILRIKKLIKVNSEISSQLSWESRRDWRQRELKDFYHFRKQWKEQILTKTHFSTMKNSSK